MVPEPGSCSVNSYQGLLIKHYKKLGMDFYYHASAFPFHSHSTKWGTSPFKTQPLPACLPRTSLVLHCLTLTPLKPQVTPLRPHTFDQAVTPLHPHTFDPPAVGMPRPSCPLALLAKCSDTSSSGEPYLTAIGVAWGSSAHPWG